MKFNTYYAVLCGIILTMKSIIKRILVLLVLGGIFMPAFAAGNKNQYVQVGSSPVKASASQFAKTVGTLKYGDEVIVISVNNKWTNIKTLDGKISGWVPNASLTTKKLKVEVASQKKTSANAKEIALAGKGWDAGFEQILATDGSSYDYNSVDAIEGFAENDLSIIQFIKEGQLYMGEEK